MSDLNVEIPTDVLDRLKLAKLLTRKSLREIAAEALEAWLKSQGIEKMPKPQPRR